MDVGFGDQLANHVDDDIALLGHQRQRHQQGGEELAGDITAHAQRLVKRQRRQAVTMADAQRREAFVAKIVDLTADLAQAVNQITDRALVHARHTLEFKLAAQQRQGRSEGAHGGTGVAEEQAGGGI
ncbi:hypothetical protein SDC9_188498 [bioreactor metagenome]|uniref:Uncharacterized protein n=1 Tax=bioreactor metagenome TaxID=1076179 RepID=A0A645HPJ0_9ZZZZ